MLQVLTRGVLLATLVLVAGCTRLPKREFQAYREAFGEVRTRADSVLADHLLARQEKTNRLRTATLAAGGALSLSENLEIRPLNPEMADSTNQGDIEVRLRAWEVLKQYNEALAAVATGATPEQIQGSVNGFLETLKNFPVREVAEVAGEAVPYAGAVSTLLELVQKEVEARRFKNAVLTAAPEIQKFIDLVLRDAALFHKYRLTLYNEEFPERQIAINLLVDQFRAIVSAHGWSPPGQVNRWIKEVNGVHVIGGIKTFEPIADVSTSGAPSLDEQKAKLVDVPALVNAITTEATLARETISRLRAYDQMMREYTALVRAWRQSLSDLALAAEHSSNQLPSLQQLEKVISAARLAENVYQQSR